MRRRPFLSLLTLFTLFHLSVAVPAESMCVTRGPDDSEMSMDMGDAAATSAPHTPAHEMPAQQRCCVEMTGCSQLGALDGASQPIAVPAPSTQRIPQSRLRPVPFFNSAPEPPPPKA
ncbi:MAG: hypothetical protein JWM95_938 [Gemmatimonadetes bacterium]|nr:hypothetical protein [Gemmatimonadota bacterium]